MIDRVHFENFKSLADVTIDLGRFTVLVGPNGCGKSSVLQGLRAHAIAGWKMASVDESSHRLGRFSLYFSDRLAPERISRVAHEPMVIAARRGGDELSFRFRPLVDGKYEVDVTVNGPDGKLSTSLPSEWTAALAVLNDPRVRAFGGSEYVELDAREMTAGNVPTEVEPRLAPTGHNLSSVLAWMKGADEDRLAVITADLAAVVPGVRRIRIQRKSVRHWGKDGRVEGTAIADTFEIEFDDGRAIAADLLSEGTVLAMGLLTKIHERGRPRLILLDDIDRGLHLSAQAELISVLRKVLENNAGLQIVCTTHSPYLLDLFKPEEVRVMALDGERRTRVRALSDHPDIEKWKVGTQTGELWATLGESWVLEAGGG